MRRINNRLEVLDAEHAEVRHRRRSALIFIGLQLPRAGAGGIILHLVRDLRQAFRFSLADHGRDEATRDRNRDADIRVLVLEHSALSPGHIRVGHTLQRHGQRLDDEVIDRNLVGRLAVFVFRSGGVDLLAQRQKRIELAVDCEIEMRDRLLGLDQTTRNRLAHRIMRDFLERTRLEEFPDGRIGHALRRTAGRSRRCRRRRSGRSDSPTASDGGFHIALDDAAMRARALDPGEINARILCQTTRERRCEQTRASGRLCDGRGRGLSGRRSCNRRRRRFLLFRGDGRSCRRGGADILAFSGDDTDERIHRHVRRAVRHDDLDQHALINGFDFHRRLVGLDLGEHVAGFDLVAFLLQPAREVALLHRRRERGHQDVDRHERRSLSDRARLSPPG